MTRKHTISIVAAIVLTVLALSPLRAQEPAQPAPSQGIETTNYLFNLGLTAGYRSSTLTNADGSVDPWSEKRFNEAYNLQKGILLNSFNLYGQKTGKDGFFDEMFLTANGINDPFTSGSFRIRQFNSYDLKVDFHQSKYYLNRNDSILSGLHKFDFTRTALNASLDIDASESVKINAQYNQTGRSGDATLTHNAMTDWFSTGGGSSGPFWISMPRDDKTSDFLASLTWAADRMTSLTLGGGVRMFKQTINGTLLADSTLPLTFVNYRKADGSPLYTYDPTIQPQVNGFSGMYGGYIAPNTATGGSVSGANPLWMTNFLQSETRDYTTPYFFFEGVAHPADQLDILANVRYETTNADPTISVAQAGWAGGLVKPKGGTYQPNDSSYTYNMNATSMNIKTNRLVGSLNAIGEITDQLSLTARYQITQSSEKGDGTYHYTVQRIHPNGSAAALYDTTLAPTVTDYATVQHEIEGFLSFAPIDMLSLKAGVRYSMITPTVTLETPETATPDSITNAVLSEKTTSMTPYLTFNLRPNKDWRIDGRYSHTTNTAKDAGGNAVDMPVRVVPKGIDNYSLGIQGVPMSNLSTSLRFTARNGSSTLVKASIDSGLLENDIRRFINLTERPYDNKMSSISASIGYAFGKMFSIDLSGEYRKNDFAIPVTWGTISHYGTAQFTMGLQPLYGDSGTFLVQQNTIDRFGDITLRMRPLDEFHLNAGFSLLSSTGGVLMDSTMRVLYSKDSISQSQNPKGAYQDRTLYGGPYHSYQFHIDASYDITPNVGIMADYQLVYYKEDKVNWANYYALNNFKASLIRGGFMLKF